MEKTILFVDDERQILKSINRMFIGSNYNLFFAGGGEEALKILSENKVHMIISDMKMPQMDGYQLLSKVKMLYPSIIRIVLSGYADEELIYKSIHSNVVKVYLLKPWKGDELKDAVDKIFEIKDNLTSKNMLNVINSIEELPKLPEIYFRLNKAIEENHGIDEISEIIQEDPSISMDILHIVNSAFYGVRTGSVKNAILNLGITNIKNIILAAKVFSEKGIPERDKKMLWKHASLTNKIIDRIYKCILNKKMADNYSSAGLLHDVGKIVMMKHFRKEYDAIQVKLKQEADVEYYKIEKQLLNVTHDEIGAYLLNWWELPQSIVEAALFHNTPNKCSSINTELISIVHIANFYSWQITDKSYVSYLDESVFDKLNFSKEDCEELISKIINEVE